MPPRAAPPAAPAQSAAPSARDSRSPTALVVAILLLALALTVGALAVVPTDRDAAVPGPSATGETVTVPAPTPTPTPTVPPSLPVKPTASERRVAEIEPLVVDYFAAIRAGDYDAAWAMLSVRYRTWKWKAGGGRSAWERSEADVRAHTTGTPEVRETEFDAASGVSTIFVSGLSYAESDGSTCAYEGITWARHSERGWKYDQGYLHDAARRARWQPIRPQTLGFLCDDSGY